MQRGSKCCAWGAWGKCMARLEMHGESIGSHGLKPEGMHKIADKDARRSMKGASHFW